MLQLRFVWVPKRCDLDYDSDRARSARTGSDESRDWHGSGTSAASSSVTMPHAHVLLAASVNSFYRCSSKGDRVNSKYSCHRISTLVKCSRIIRFTSNRLQTITQETCSTRPLAGSGDVRGARLPGLATRDPLLPTAGGRTRSPPSAIAEEVSRSTPPLCGETPPVSCVARPADEDPPGRSPLALSTCYR
jgi:hypothetical protein